MRQHVGIGMPEKTARVLDSNAAEDELAAFSECMHVEALADTQMRRIEREGVSERVRHHRSRSFKYMARTAAANIR